MDKKIYTIGYTAFDIENFIKEIKNIGITCIIDVRSFPKSNYYKDFEIPTPIYETYNLIDGDVLNYSLIKPNATSAGEYQYQVVLGENPNYEVEVVPCKLIVNKVNYPIDIYCQYGI